MSEAGPAARGADATRWRPEIQALRAIAVLLVVLFHLWPNIVRGGFVGVDAFFVISGFLITAHLLRDIQTTGRVGLVAFWARRIRRLLPAAFVVLIVVFVATLALVPRSEWAEFLTEIAASAGYVVNWVLATNSVDYFSQANLASPVQHYWSLSAEEQFYLIWPVLLLLVALVVRRNARRRTGAIGILMAVVFVACLTVSIIGSIVSPQYFYFATPAHGWEFAAGGLLAWAHQVRQERGAPLVVISDAARGIAAWLGYLLLLSSGLLLTGATPFPGWIAIWPVAGVLLVIWGGATDAPWSSSRIARWRPVQFVGDISYSLYLWHWPPIALAVIVLGPNRSRGWVPFAILAFSILAGYLSTRFIENPIRRAPRLVASRALTYGLAAAVTCVLVGTSLTVVEGIGVAQSSSVADSRALARQAVARHIGCFGAAAVTANGSLCTNPKLASTLYPSPVAASQDRGGFPGHCWAPAGTLVKRCEFGQKQNPTLRVALVGDSHAEQYSSALRDLAIANHWLLTTYVKSSCGWRAQSGNSLIEPAPQNADCRGWNRGVQQQLRKDKPDVIVTSSYSHDLLAGTDPSRASAVLKSSGQLIARAWSPELAKGAQLLAITDTPHWNDLPADCLATKQPNQWSTCSEPRATGLLAPDPQATAVGESTGATLLDLSRYFCVGSTCPAEIGSVVVYRDRHHLTSTYVLTLSPILEKAIEALAH